ncbi:class I SAM-dependent methyltransferase [Thiohalobacter thiocyanaticus]|uniref:Methyltransferase domain-containing protein n=1 Tax=Thiohalobacter thiocyanaticus TaxID=585455 RepID=A0A426QGA8_9GAMM|nr:methyltransferase domain-containing protein [Thiohalobacter thiocyanaticus]RRQ20789.1 methyltransferase domain-containing protein [Thiohalobacter thiocyanaticus]
MTDPDTLKLKQRERDNWSSAAEGWRRRHALLNKGAAPVSERMLALARVEPGCHVLDIASGTGEPALTAARWVGDTGRVIGTDLVEEMVAVARDLAAAAGLDNLEFHCCDAEALDLSEQAFDAVTIRWGLMFMPEPHRCLEAAHRALKPGGRISLACWTAPENNPFVALLMKTLANYMEIPAPPPGSPGIFAFADPGRLHGALAAAGFADIALEEQHIEVFEVADGEAYWDVISDLAAPVMALVNQLDAASRTAYIEEVIRTADTLRQSDSLRMSGSTWIASAGKD